MFSTIPSFIAALCLVSFALSSLGCGSPGCDYTDDYVEDYEYPGEYEPDDYDLGDYDPDDSVRSLGTGPGGCSDTCDWANDGQCDDGGPGADYFDCALGTDCGDCGPR